MSLVVWRSVRSTKWQRWYNLKSLLLYSIIFIVMSYELWHYDYQLSCALMTSLLHYHDGGDLFLSSSPQRSLPFVILESIIIGIIIIIIARRTVTFLIYYSMRIILCYIVIFYIIIFYYYILLLFLFFRRVVGLLIGIILLRSKL